MVASAASGIPTAPLTAHPGNRGPGERSARTISACTASPGNWTRTALEDRSSPLKAGVVPVPRTVLVPSCIRPARGTVPRLERNAATASRTGFGTGTSSELRLSPQFRGQIQERCSLKNAMARCQANLAGSSEWRGVEWLWNPRRVPGSVCISKLMPAAVRAALYSSRTALIR